MGERGSPDLLGRPLRDLRISLTDRCNLRCGYCMPRSVFGADYPFLPSDRLLDFDQIERVTRIAAAGGVTKLRLTGGEPLLRPGILDLVSRLRAIGRPDGGPLDLAMTTNATALARLARPLREAGLNRVTVSLDTLDEETFSRMSDTRIPLGRVLDGLKAAIDAGFDAVKVNTVLRRGINDHEIESLAEHFRATGVTVRFIEYMDVGSSNGWRLDDVVPSAEVVERIGARHPLIAADERGSATAERWRYADGSGEIGVISSVTQAFCGSCTRARLSADGTLFTCLFASSGTDLLPALRTSDDGAIADALFGAWRRRDDRYSELRGAATPTNGSRIEMSYIGG